MKIFIINITITIQQTHVLLREMRELGLYVDEHRDFNEEMERLREGKDIYFSLWTDRNLIIWFGTRKQAGLRSKCTDY